MIEYLKKKLELMRKPVMSKPRQIGCFVEFNKYGDAWAVLLEKFVGSLGKYAEAVYNSSKTIGFSNSDCVLKGKWYHYSTDEGYDVLCDCILKYDDDVIFNGKVFQGGAWCLKSFFDMDKPDELIKATKTINAIADSVRAKHRRKNDARDEKIFAALSKS